HSVLRAKDATGLAAADRMFGRAKNIIFLYLSGGPPQHETFDPKPHAPAEMRGPFRPISTNVPGIQFCELLPRTAAIADKLAVVRSLSTDDNSHESSGYWVLTGYKYLGTNPRKIQPTDWPYFGSIIKRYRPSDDLPPLSTVWLPDILRLNENVTPAGQTAGFMGTEFDPERFVGDPSKPGYRVAGLNTEHMPSLQFDSRRRLLEHVDRGFVGLTRSGDIGLYEKYQAQTFDLLTSGRAQEAFSIDREPPEVRDRYGRNSWGQSLVLARRLIEAGVRLVHVGWPREPGDNAVDNPLWDTHAQNADRVEDVLCPMFDVGYSALIADLDERGLLDETLVVAVGEFGRTPKINASGGRDHWGPVFCATLAGAGISGGQVFGASDREGAYPVENKVHPGDLTATMFHLVGLDPQSTFEDRVGRPHPVTGGEPIHKLLGTEPATTQRAVATGDIARVPPFDPAITLMQADFHGKPAIRAIDAPSQPKGWRGSPLVDAGWGVAIREGRAQLGMLASPSATSDSSSPLILAQQVRSPFAGKYSLQLRLRGVADTPEQFEQLFLPHFRARVQFFQFTEPTKCALNRRELAGIDVAPKFAAAGSDDWQTVELAKEFFNPNLGANFSFGLGLGIALIIERSRPGNVAIPAGNSLLGIEVADVRLVFDGKPRVDTVRI
ncbi:MAG: DUF1501 domain-containing protein, partial [Planctomycetaceae bacterium]|nr:DUF1501 domain-containing protein [Planctomycetaceae bacterium]